MENIVPEDVGKAFTKAKNSLSFLDRIIWE
jgi:hypothetical protein